LQTTENNMISRIYGHGRGWCFTPSSFLDLGSHDAVRQALKRLENKGKIRSIARGLYDYPRTHKAIGELPPDLEKAAEAVAQKFGLRIQASGAYAANLLGLSEQVPAKVVFLTDGSSKKIKIANTEVMFRKTTPKNMKLAGSAAGLVIQAFKYMGKQHITPKIAAGVLLRLRLDDKQFLLKNLSASPSWIAKLIKSVAEEAT
jgi:hypothetical protein